MSKHSRLILVAATSAAFGIASPASSDPAKMGHAHAHAAGTTAPSDQAIIASAMSAAPAAVGAKASVIAPKPDGSMRVVREGTNGFTCMADNPTTPGPDPMCMDANALEWAKAWMTHQPPPDKVGFMYMLSGGTDASNTDPYAQAPAAQNNWVKTGPHVMVVGAPSLLAAYPADPNPNTAEPYVMWSGTPYAHLMAPVK